MGRLWRTLILSRWHPLFAFLPVETVIRDLQADYYKVLGALRHRCGSGLRSTPLDRVGHRFWARSRLKAENTEPTPPRMGTENDSLEETGTGASDLPGTETSEAEGKAPKFDLRFFDFERLRQAAEPFRRLYVENLFDKAEPEWERVTKRLRVPKIQALPIGPLAEAIDLGWPSTRFSEPIEQFLAVRTPRELLRLRAIGKRKAHTLLVIVLSLESLVEQGLLTDGGREEIVRQIPSDPIERVNMFWSEIKESIPSSEIANERVHDLARRWGIQWPTRTKIHHTLDEIVAADSLRGFVSRARSMGKRKLPSLAEIVWRAWQVAEPDGPAGPPRTAADAAEEEYAQLAEAVGAEGVVLRALQLAGVTKHENSIILRRHGLGGDPPMTLEEVGSQDGVTRERIRQIQQKAENRTRDHQVSHQLLKLCLEKERPRILEGLQARSGSELLKLGHDLHRRLAPAHSFLVEILHDGIYQFLDHLVDQGRIQKTAAGWWLGATLPPDSQAIAERVRVRINEARRPLPLRLVANEVEVPPDTLESILLSEGCRVEMGYVFLKRLSTPQQRCLFAIQIAMEAQQWLWAELDFYKASVAMDPQKAGSLRLLLRDTECIPGVGIDIPGPYVVVNPPAVRNAKRKVPGPTAETREPYEVKEEQDADTEEAEDDSFWDAVNDDTLAGNVQALLEQNRILKFEDLEEKFCEAALGSPGSLGPTLLSRPQFVRYAPSYWGIAGLELEEPDIEQLCTEPNLQQYVRSRGLGGLNELFAFWNFEMEYRWCRWAERFASEDLFHSLLAICEPRKWSTSEAIQVQWVGKKDRLGIYRLPPIQPSLEMAYTGFEPIYGLVHLAHQKRSIGPMTIPHFYGLRSADRKSYGTMALLGAIGVLDPRADMESPWQAGDRVEEWLELMSELHYLDPLNARIRWREILQSAVNELDPDGDFGWFSGQELQRSYARWRTDDENIA